MLAKVQEKVTTVTNVVTPSGAMTAGVSYLTLNQWLAVGGFVIALASFLINWYYQEKRFQLEKEQLKK